MPPLIFPRVSTADALDKIVAQTLTLRFYSNSHTPIPTDVMGTYTELAGSGYAAFPLVTANWVITPGSPSIALYNSYIVFTFTAALPTPVNIYGYYVTSSSGLLIYAEQFYSTGIAVQRGNGDIIRIRPRFGADNLVNDALEIIP